MFSRAFFAPLDPSVDRERIVDKLDFIAKLPKFDDPIVDFEVQQDLEHNVNPQIIRFFPLSKGLNLSEKDRILFPLQVKN